MRCSANTMALSLQNVHVRMMDLSPSQTGLLAQTPWRSPDSYTHCFLTCMESSSTPSRVAARELARFASVAFPLTFSELNVPPASTSVYASTGFFAESSARLEVRMESLLVSCKALASPAMCRFGPALCPQNLPETFILMESSQATKSPPEKYRKSNQSKVPLRRLFSCDYLHLRHAQRGKLTRRKYSQPSL